MGAVAVERGSVAAARGVVEGHYYLARHGEEAVEGVPMPISPCMRMLGFQTPLPCEAAGRRANHARQRRRSTRCGGGSERGMQRCTQQASQACGKVLNRVRHVSQRPVRSAGTRKGLAFGSTSTSSAIAIAMRLRRRLEGREPRTACRVQGGRAANESVPEKGQCEPCPPSSIIRRRLLEDARKANVEWAKHGHPGRLARLNASRRPRNLDGRTAHPPPVWSRGPLRPPPGPHST